MNKLEEINMTVDEPVTRDLNIQISIDAEQGKDGRESYCKVNINGELVDVLRVNLSETLLGHGIVEGRLTIDFERYSFDVADEVA